MMLAQAAEPSNATIWVAVIVTGGTFVTAVVTGVITLLSKRSSTREHGDVIAEIRDVKGDVRDIKADVHDLKDDVRELQSRDPDSRTRSTD